MKKYLSLFIITVFVFSLASLAFAEDNSGPNLRDALRHSRDQIKKDQVDLKDQTGELKQNIQDIKDVGQQQIEEKKGQIKALRDITKQKLEDLKTKIKTEKNTAKSKIKEARIASREDALNKFDEKVANINLLIDKVTAQIIKFSARGVDTADAKNFVAEAEAKLALIEGQITKMNALFAGSTDALSTVDKTNLKTLKDGIQASFQDAHTALTNAIKSLKEKVASTPLPAPAENQ